MSELQRSEAVHFLLRRAPFWTTVEYKSLGTLFWLRANTP